MKKPTIINLPITEVCDSKCIMCNVWSAGKLDQFTSENIIKIFKQDFYNKVQHIGISGGEPTLNEDLVQICYSLLEALPSLKTLSMTSHGYHIEKHRQILPLIKKACEEKNVSFSLNLSLDGIEEVHIKVRRIADAFQKVINTAELVKSLGIHVQLQCTISPVNVYNIVKVREYALKNNYEVVFRIASYIARLSNGDLVEKIKLSDKERSFVADFLESKRTVMAANSLGRRLFYGDLAERLRSYAPRKAPCAFQKNALFISPDQSIYNCSRSENRLEIDDICEVDKSINSSYNQTVLTELTKNTCTDCYHDQSGRWPLWNYFTVHDISYDYFQKFLKFKKIPSIIKNAVLPVKSERLAHTKKAGKFLIIGCYGGEHVGDAAILGGVILRMIEKYQITNFEILSIRRDRTECWVDNLKIPDTKFSVLGLNDKINPLDYDGLVLAGGPIMGIPTLLSQHLSLIRSFKSYSVPFFVEGVGVGPLPTKLTKILANRIINFADAITVRTNEDLSRAKKIRTDVAKTQDPAFDYLNFVKSDVDACGDKYLRKILDTSKDIWVLNIRPLWKAYTSKGTDIANREENLLDSLVNTLNKYKANRRFVFMTMNADQYGFSDLEIAYKLEDKIKASFSDIDYKIWETEPDINDCVYLLKHSKLTISMRFHGCIFSLANDIPTIGVDYSTSEKGKVYSLFKDRKLDDQVINIQNFNSEALENIINKVLVVEDKTLEVQ